MSRSQLVGTTTTTAASNRLAGTTTTEIPRSRTAGTTTVTFRMAGTTMEITGITTT
jgi:hypothetical protein